MPKQQTNPNIASKIDPCSQFLLQRHPCKDKLLFPLPPPKKSMQGYKSPVPTSPIGDDKFNYLNVTAKLIDC